MKTAIQGKLDPQVTGITPGEVLATEFLEPLGITPYRLAMATGMPRSRVSDIMKGKRAITEEAGSPPAMTGRTPNTVQLARS